MQPAISRSPFPTISAKICACFLGLLLVAGANIAVARFLLRELNGVAETVNVAGKLRMLSQKIAYDSTAALYQDRAGEGALARSIADYDLALAALLSGGEAFGYTMRPPSPTLRLELAALKAEWERGRSERAGIARVRPVTLAAAMIERAQAAQLARAEQVVLALTIEARALQAAALAKMLALLAINVLVLLAAFVRLRRDILAPLRLLAHHCLALARGDYQARVPVGSEDEIGQLGAAFNHSAERIGELVASLERDRQGIRRAETTFRGLADNSVVGVYIVQDHRFRFVNPKMAAMFGYQREELTAGVSLFDLVVEDERALVEKNILRRISGEVREVHYERRARRKNGSTFDIEVYGSSMDIDGKPSTIGIILDITERKRAERAMRLQNACGEALIRGADETTLLEQICAIVHRVGGYPWVWVAYADGADARNARALDGRDPGPLRAALAQINASGEWRRDATSAAIGSGRTVRSDTLREDAACPGWQRFARSCELASVMALPLRAGAEVIGALTVYAGVPDAFRAEEVPILERLADNLAYGITALRVEAARQRYEKQLEYGANYDCLTGLANRNLLSDRLRLAMAGAARQGKMVAILLHDLDNFKVINDSLGHDAGDCLLKAVAQRMRAVVREGDTVARMGGDEFVLVIPDLESAEEVMVVANKLLAELAKPFMVEQQQVYVSASIGVSVFPRDGQQEQLLLKNADLAMYRAKRDGRNTVSFFTEQLNAHNRERQTLETALHHALENEEFELHYQPKYDQPSGAITGVESLVRWNHPTRGQIGPAAFIALAEETGLIVPLGTWVLRTACHQARAWQLAGFAPLTIAVNLSARQLVKDELLRAVAAALYDSGLDARWLELELTETAIMHDALEAIDILGEIKALGVRLALDDFGTGYSSLSHLRRFPLDAVKIDRSFITGLGESAHDRAIVKTIIALAANLGMDVIAEGVETPGQAKFLRKLGCDAMQGYLFAAPLPPQGVSKLLAASSAMRVA